MAAGVVPVPPSEYSPAFDPILPDPAALLGMAAIVGLSALAVRVWATQVVPVSRTNLALSKRSGKVREYLDDLLALDSADDVVGVASDEGGFESRPAVAHALTSASESRPADEASPADAPGEPEFPDEAPASTEKIPGGPGRQQERAFERWLFSDWLSQARGRGRGRDRKGRSTVVPAGRQKDPAIPVLLPNAKWNSGDNPVLVASALIAMGVVASAIVEKLLR
jgi:hypothetical protein